MKRIKTAILASIVLIGLLVGTRIWINLQAKRAVDESSVPKISVDGAADARLEKIRFVEDKEGRKTWELEATAVEQYQDQNMMVVENAMVTFFMKDGRSFVLSGNQGKVYQDSKDMELTGDVVLTSNDGYRLKTHSIFYDHSKKKATTSDPVEIEGEQFHLAGKGMLVDMEAKTFKILSQVRTRWRGGQG
jgi:LPS export ABC transporter protein LptC